MINDISIPGVQLWKYIDDIIISEPMVKKQPSRIQAAVDDLCDKTKADKFQHNEIKCKELRIDFSKSDKGFNLVNSWIKLSTAKTANAERRLAVCHLPFRPRCSSV